MKEPKLKYAFKVGMSAAMLTAPAFFDATRPIFTDYKGEWALISVRTGGFAFICLADFFLFSSLGSCRLRLELYDDFLLVLCPC